MFLVAGVLAALWHPRETGEGQVVDAAMTEGAGFLGTMTRALAGLGMWQDTRVANLLDGSAQLPLLRGVRRSVDGGGRHRAAVLG
jgi:alpha-methylacyl-CoA racemase